jgi:hypothetical protein
MFARRFFLIFTFSMAAMSSMWARDLKFHVKVLSSSTSEFEGPPLAPRDCNWRDISAYCDMSSPKLYTENTMVVQKPDGTSLEIGCTVYNRWSRCKMLPVNEDLEAQVTKRGLKIRYPDQHGKMREQVYAILSGSGEGKREVD